MKASLRKFKSRDQLAQPDQFQVKKEEDTFIADVKSALIADGWRPPSGPSEWLASASGSNVKQNSQYYQGRKNKLGPDGKPMKCINCDSEYHFAGSPYCEKVQVEETPQRNPSSQKQKKKPSSKGKKKTTETTMLSQLLAKRSEYSMMCEVVEIDAPDREEKVQSLSSLFVGQQESDTSMHACETVHVNVVECSSVVKCLSDGSTNQLGSLAQLLSQHITPEVVVVDAPARVEENGCSPDSLDVISECSVAVNDSHSLPDTSSETNTGVAMDDFTGELQSKLNSVSLLGNVSVDDAPDSSSNGESVEEKYYLSTRYDHFFSLADLSSGLEGVKYDTSETFEHEIILVSQQENELCFLVEEAGTRGVIDTGCSKSVSGLGWVEKYTKSISPDFAEKLQLAPSSKVYAFGGGERRVSKGCVTLPTLIGDLIVDISMDIVDAAIPLLIGSNSLETGKAVLNFQTSEATFFTEVVPMVRVCTGHYCIELNSENLLTHIANSDERYNKVHEVLVSTQNLSIKDLRKLHHYYGHTPCDKLLKFLKKTGKETESLKEELLKVEKSCESCVRTKRRKPRPRCAIPRADAPNQILTIDLKEWTTTGSKSYICYMIDMFSRLTIGGFIKNKHPDTVVNCLLEHWISRYGKMKAIHSDIGHEISNSTMKDVADKLGVELTTTAAYSPTKMA